MMDNIAEYLASYGSSIKYEVIPLEVTHRVKTLLIDALGCAIGGYASEAGKIARRIAGRFYHGDMPATILGSGKKSSPELAAFANGVMIRYLDFNDTFNSKEGGHPSDNFASVLTCADTIHASGKEVITASVLAYEVYCRLADQLALISRGLDHPVIGVISCVMGASKVFNLSRDQMVEAINLAVTPNISLRQTRVGKVSMWKGCAMANAARNAVFAAVLAKEGMTGPSPIFEGQYGFFTGVSGDAFQLEEFGGDGRPFRIMDVSIKRYPCGNYGQTAIDAAIGLRSQLSNLHEIIQITIGTCAYGKITMAGDAEKWHPTTRESADHSLPYVFTVALMNGALDIRHFDEEYLHNPDVLELIQKIRVEETEECSTLYPDARATRVELVTKSGEKLSEFVQYHRGHHRNPCTDEETEKKFHSLTRDLLTHTQRSRLLTLLWNLEEVEDVGDIMELLKI
jgi:2-methylcitrate dehydratase